MTTALAIGSTMKNPTPLHVHLQHDSEASHYWLDYNHHRLLRPQTTLLASSERNRRWRKIFTNFPVAMRPCQIPADYRKLTNNCTRMRGFKKRHVSNTENQTHP